MHNPNLADRRGISQESRDKIDELHKQIDNLIKRGSIGVYEESVFKEIEQIENELQALWLFDVNPDYHTHKHAYKALVHKSQWAGSQWVCMNTQEVFTVPDDVYETACYTWGDGALLDVGRVGMYFRHSGCLEVTKEI